MTRHSPFRTALATTMLLAALALAAGCTRSDSTERRDGNGTEVGGVTILPFPSAGGY